VISERQKKKKTRLVEKLKQNQKTMSAMVEPTQTGLNSKSAPVDATVDVVSSSEETERLLKRLHEVSHRGVELVRKFASIDPTLETVVLEWDGDEAGDDADTDSKQKQQLMPNPWKDPESMLARLKVARDELTEAWNALEEQHQKDKKKKEQEEAEEEGGNEPDEEQFRVLYMDMVTDAFGDVLDQIRLEQQGSTSTTTPAGNNGSDVVGVDVDMLVDCLQSGMEFLDPSDRNKRFLDDFEAMDDDDDDDDDEKDLDGLEGDDDNEDEAGLTCHEMRQREIGYPS
jgi:hypothetical protein